jgi:acetoacetate decarboxylase
MDEKTLLKTAYGMPLIRPAYPNSGSRMLNRETLAIRYRTDPDAVRKWVPEPLKIVEPVVTFEVVHMPDCSGLGGYHESGQTIEVELDGALGSLSHMMYLDNIAGMTAGREVLGFPKKLGFPSLGLDGDTMVGTLDIGKTRVATATMGYKYEALDSAAIKQQAESSNNFLLKMIPHVDGSLRICELVQYPITNVVTKGAWSGPGSLQFAPHALAPLTDLPVLEVLETTHTIMDMSLGLGKVVHDYLTGVET